jgi:hypothetical protein
MIDDPDTFRAAKLLINQHGEGAALRAYVLLEVADLDGSAVWRRILAGVEELRGGGRASAVSLAAPKRTVALAPSG